MGKPNIQTKVINIWFTAGTHTDLTFCCHIPQTDSKYELVCRVAYELMQTRHAELGDASGLAWSLDSIYYFGGQQSNPYKMIIADETTGSKPGDLFHVDGNSWNGYADLHSIPNNTKVKLPAYKVYPRVLTVEITEIMPV
ncbi:Alpha-(1 6)-fucosyltransferase [Paragonimus kellicotti]|nr:Alpha-(1 6)-fucosyltransferase [Paragonimus kellicotti]